MIIKFVEKSKKYEYLDDIQNFVLI